MPAEYQEEYDEKVKEWESSTDYSKLPESKSSDNILPTKSKRFFTGKKKTVFTMVVYEPAASMIKPRRTKGT
jgi:hypothetical protein